MLRAGEDRRRSVHHQPRGGAGVRGEHERLRREPGTGRRGNHQRRHAHRAPIPSPDRCSPSTASANLSASEDFLGRSRDERDFSTTQWGGSVGGPILKNKLLFFAAFERFDSRETLFIADLADRTGRDRRGHFPRLARPHARHPAGEVRPGPEPAAGGSVRPEPHCQHRVRARRLEHLAQPDADVALQLHRLGQPAERRRGPAARNLRCPLRLRLGRAAAARLAALVRRHLVAERAAVRLVHRPDARSRRSVRCPAGSCGSSSDLPDGTVGDVRVQFGGNRLAPDVSREWQYQLVDQFVDAEGQRAVLGRHGQHLYPAAYLHRGGTERAVRVRFARAPWMHSRRRGIPGACRSTSDSTLTRQTVLELGAYAPGGVAPVAPP